MTAAGLYIAAQKGYSTDAGLHVPISSTAGSSSAIPYLVTGRVQVVFGNYVSDILAQAKGVASLRFLAAGNVSGPRGQEMVVLPGSPVTSVTANVPVRYPSPAMWWDASWSRAPRISWQHIPPDLLPGARAQALSLLDPLRDPVDGSVTRTARFAWTVGMRRRPPLERGCRTLMSTESWGVGCRLGRSEL